MPTADAVDESARLLNIISRDMIDIGSLTTSVKFGKYVVTSSCFNKMGQIMGKKKEGKRDRRKK